MKNDLGGVICIYGRALAATAMSDGQQPTSFYIDIAGHFNG